MAATAPDQLEQRIGYDFQDQSLLKRALTHASTNTLKQNGSKRDNERLEFLGDRVLGLVIAEILFKTHPEEPEGDLARRHTALVRKEALASVAKDIELGEHIIMIKAEETSGGRENPAILANSCEALIAALYLDGGMETATNFIKTHWETLFQETPQPPQDNKTALQEWAQSKGLGLPIYAEMGRDGPDHAPNFEIQVRLPGYPGISATGPSKRKAEQEAAGLMLSTLTDTKND